MIRHLDATRVCGAVVIAALLTACGGSTGRLSASPQTSPANSTVHPESRSATKGPDAKTISAAGKILPGDTVLCRKTDLIPGGGLFSGTITISRWVSADVPPEDIYSLSLDRSFPGWTGEGASCGPPTTWSADFSKKLVSGSPPNASSSHIAVVDLATGTVRDLTEARQQTGFGAAVLNETDPIFLSDTPSDKVTFGSNVVAFMGHGDGLSSLTLQSPTSLKPVTSATTIGQHVLPGHPEYQSNVGDGPYNRASPDGAFFVPFESSLGIAPSAHIDQPMTVKCANLEPGVDDQVLGWTDSTHLVIAGRSSASPTSGVVDLVTVGLRLTCESLIPTTDKQISGIEMLPDRSAVFFTAEGPKGAEDYSVPTTGAATQPTPGSYPQMSAETVLYYPGNY